MQVQLSDVQSFYHEDGKSPFKHMPWKHGCMHYSFEYVRATAHCVHTGTLKYA